MSVLAQQLLHGYADGHRLLAASIDLPSDVQRRLLIHSDALPGPDGGRTLGSLALPEVGLWGITATWPALEMPRAGSVWSHTLLLAREAVAGLSGAGGILKAFHRPQQGDYLSYRQPLQIIDAPARPAPKSRRLLEAVLLAFYGFRDEPTAVLAKDLAQAEVALLGAWEQQWTALRATASFATRARIEDESTARVQVGSGSPRGRRAVHLLAADQNLATQPPAWVTALTSDVFNPGSLRGLLHHYGPNGRRGTADVVLLAQLDRTLSSPQPTLEAFAPLAHAYPAPSEMEVLKHDCLERASIFTATPERWRLATAIAFHANVEWRSLALGRRLADLLPTEPTSVVDLLELASRQSDTELEEELIEAVAERADGPFFLLLATSDVALAAQLAFRRPDLLHDDSLWREPQAWQTPLLETLADDGGRDSALGEFLLHAGDDDLAGTAARAGLVPPSALAEAIALEGFSADARRRYAKVLGKINYVPERNDRGWRGLTLAVLASKDWKPLARRYGKKLARHLRDLDERSQLELAAKLLAANRTGQNEHDVMRTVFPVLHRALVSEMLPELQWREIDQVLPPGRHWDRAERLRMALLETIERGSWTEDEVVQVIREAGPEAERLRDLADKRSDVRKWLDAAWEVLTFWA